MKQQYAPARLGQFIYGQGACQVKNMSSHRFAIGQYVRMRNRFGHSPDTAKIYRITATLPSRDNSPQYRIRNDDERHERMTTEDNLEEIKVQQASGGAAHD
ncbi:hypothetical protein [Chelativorans xinjiangense]|uniref:hypothetical protein n=1 Tax=Chelativorans xinjiangense TaxID=2681485 RepID=UPI001FE5E5D9|nr:hypothetical protein [Chelativorans xinjiangense]